MVKVGFTNAPQDVTGIVIRSICIGSQFFQKDPFEAAITIAELAQAYIQQYCPTVE
jgi:hypothetical protein